MRISEDNFGLSVETFSFLSTLRPPDKDGFYKLIQRYFSVNCMLAFLITVKILKFGTPQTIAIIVLKLVKFDVTLH